MPPIRSQRSRNSYEREGRLLLAVSAIKEAKVMSIRQAARLYQVPESTLRTRLNGVSFHAETRANSHKMTQNEEESLV